MDKRISKYVESWGLDQMCDAIDTLTVDTDVLLLVNALRGANFKVESYKNVEERVWRMCVSWSGDDPFSVSELLRCFERSGVFTVSEYIDNKRPLVYITFKKKK